MACCSSLPAKFNFRSQNRRLNNWSSESLSQATGRVRSRRFRLILRKPHLKFFRELLLIRIAHRLDAAASLEAGEVKQLEVGELRAGHVADTGEYRFDTAGKFLLPFKQHVLHDGALHIRLRAAQRAGDDGKRASRR